MSSQQPSGFGVVGDGRELTQLSHSEFGRQHKADLKRKGPDRPDRGSHKQKRSNKSWSKELKYVKLKENLDQLVLNSRDPNYTWNGGMSDWPGPPEMTPAVAQTLLEIIRLCEDFRLQKSPTLEVSKEALKVLVDLELDEILTGDDDGENFIALYFSAGYARIDLPKEFIVSHNRFTIFKHWDVRVYIDRYYELGHDEAFEYVHDLHPQITVKDMGLVLLEANFTDRGLH